jgi:hypothetical protein
VKNRFMILAGIIFLFIAASFLMVSCSEKRTPPTLVLIPTNTFTITKTALPTKTSTPTMTPTFTVTPTNTPIQLIYHFDSAAELGGGPGQWGTNYEPAFTTIDWTSDAAAQKYSGPGSVSVTVSFDGGGSTTGGFAVGLNVTPPDLTGKLITVHMWLPSTMVGQPYQVEVYIWNSMYAEQKVTYSLDSGSYTGNAWNTFTYSPVGVGEATVNYLAVRIVQNSGPNLTETIYIDEITAL